MRFFAFIAFRLYRVTSTIRHRVRRRFTETGLVLAVAGGLALVVGADLERSLAYQAVALVFGLLLLAMLMAPTFRGRFQVERVLPRFGCVNETLSYRVWLTNQGKKPLQGLELLEDFPDARPDFAEYYERVKPSSYNRTFQLSTPLPGVRLARSQPVTIPPLAAYGRVAFQGEVTPLKRGPLHFLAATIARPDPFGLFRGFRREPTSQTVLILPKRYPLPRLALPGRTKYQQGGVALASGIGESEEFTALRDYRRGDSLRRIHWRSWARLGRPIVKEYQDEFFVRHGLVLDTFCNVALDEVFEDAVSVAASFACTIPDQDSLLDLMFVGTRTVCLTTGRSVGHIEQMLEVLSVVKPCREPRFQDLTNRVVGHGKALSGCILVLLAWDEPRRELVRRLKQLRVPQHVLLLVRPGEAKNIERGPAADQPDRFDIIEAGRVAEALARL
jgi:uncharacterized protein (DUF58 family)